MTKHVYKSYWPRHKGLMCWHENQENTRNATSYGDVGRESPTVIWTSLCHPISNDAWRGSDLKNPKFEGYKEKCLRKEKLLSGVDTHISHVTFTYHIKFTFKAFKSYPNSSNATLFSRSHKFGCSLSCRTASQDIANGASELKHGT